MRQGLRAVLGAAEDIIVVGETGDGQSAVELAAELRPDVVIMDLQLPRRHGTDATQEIVSRQPGVSVLVLTMFEEDDMVFAAISAGAAGYLLKGADGADIIAAVRAAAAGQAVFGAALAQRLRTWFTAGPRPQATPFPQLTEREREILDGVAAGLSNAQIGQQMYPPTEMLADRHYGDIDLAKLAVAAYGYRWICLRRELSL
jgi:DNA-binding NarL/FixJ family response regulator